MFCFDFCAWTTSPSCEGYTTIARLLYLGYPSRIISHDHRTKDAQPPYDFRTMRFCRRQDLKFFGQVESQDLFQVWCLVNNLEEFEVFISIFCESRFEVKTMCWMASFIYSCLHLFGDLRHSAIFGWLTAKTKTSISRQPLHQSRRYWAHFHRCDCVQGKVSTFSSFYR